MRPSKSDYYMTIAKAVARRSTCTRRQLGAVIVLDDCIVGTGYNGAPRGLPHCSVVGCLRDELKIQSGTRHEICRAVHAEQNAIIQATARGYLRGAGLYCEVSPCMICAKMIINAGIKAVMCEDIYPDINALNLLNDAGVKVWVLPEE